MSGRARRRAGRGEAPRGPRHLPLLLGVAAIAFAIRLLYLAGAAQSPLYLHPTLDARINDAEAWELASGGGGAATAAAAATRAAAPASMALEPDPARRPYFRPPGYAYFLAAVYAVAGHDLHAAHVAQAALGALTVLLLGLLAASVWSPRAGVVAGVLAALYGPAIYFEGELVSASLELFLAALALWLLIEGGRRRSLRWCAAAGLALAAAAVTRPTLLPFALVALLWLWRRGLPPAALALFAAATLSLPLAATARNYVVARDPVFIASQGGINFYIGNHSRADGTTPHVPGLGSGVTATYEAPYREASRWVGRPLLASQVSAFWFQRGLRFWREEPGAALTLYAKKIAMIWNRRELPNTQDQAFFAPFHSWLFRGPWLLGFAWLAPIALAAAWFERRRATPLLLFAGSLTAVTAAFFVCDRFRLPLVVAVVPLAAQGLLAAWDWRKSGGRPAGRATALAAGAVLGAALLVWVPFPRWQRVEEGMSWFRLAVAYGERRDVARANHAYAEAERAGLATPELFNNGGLLALRSGDLDTAEKRFTRAIQLEPGHGPALANMAEVMVRREKWPQAAQFYRYAAAAIPEQSAELWTNAGAIHQRAGHLGEARRDYEQALAARPGFPPAAEGLRSLPLTPER
jgi:4-amino-4-deoxy-L-arabinose transferase-like glycosyltransferase